MINTVLFDLDGTLLPIQWEIFEAEYFKALANKLVCHFDAAALKSQVWKSTMKMIENTGGQRTNEQVFFQDFTTSTGKNSEVLSPIFDEFYMKEFNDLKRFTRVEPYIVQAVDILCKRGYDMVIATNPLFPLSAIKARIGWAGLDYRVFKYITCFEDMHYCKPNIEFFGEVLRVIGRRPDECIMVGNDVDEDIIASRLGVKTFLITDNIINRSGSRPPADYTGNYKEFYGFINDNLPDITRSHDSECL